tara:strand:+ start:77925 stop:79748 length:1824 start_codon:yes stop_codon:yes gene_type:complete
MQYRPDIQILRGVSVLLVVMFHLNIGFFHSGFLGVDVFFVISGFLMSQLYTAGENRKFFSRRAKRLLPAYFITVLVTLAVAVFVTVPVDFNQVVTQSIYASVFSSNIGYWMLAPYFSKAEFNPLLHLWSLGVEIQFYLIVPVLAWLFRRIPLSALLLTCLSALACFYILIVSPKTSFYMMPLRLWEFMIGYLAATLFTREGSAKAGYSALGLVGLVSILLIPIIPVDGGAQNFMNGHPGLYALGVSLAAALVLIFGLPKTLAARHPFKAMEKLGEYSYSIYLAHFPIIILYLYKPFSGTRFSMYEGRSFTVLIALILGASFLLYRFIESPARGNSSDIKRKWLIPASVVGICAISILGSKFQAGFYSKGEMQIFYAWEDRDDFRCGKLIRVLQPRAKVCDLTPDVTTPNHRVLLVGNSHADSIKASLANVSREHNSKLFFTVGMAPLMKGGQTVADLIRYAEVHSFDAFIVHHSPNAIKPEIIRELVGAAERKGISVVLILPVPVWGAHIPQAHYAHITSDYPLPQKDVNNYKSENKEFLLEVKSIRSPNYVYLETAPIFCDTKCMTRTSEGALIYFDSGHLTITGSTLLDDVFSEALTFISARSQD